MALFNRSEIQEIQEAVAAVEQRTSGELVVAVLPRCSGYEAARGSAALISTLLVTYIGYVWYNFLSGAELLLGQMLAFGLAWWLFGRPSFLSLMLNPTQKRRACRNRAFQLFSSRGIYRTRSHSGVLLLISELEKEAVILGDQGIDALLGAEGWARRLEAVLAGFRQRQGKQGLLSVIQDIGDILAQHFPPEPGDTNELPDEVVREEG